MEHSSSPDATPLRELTCRMWSHGVTCHPADVTFPPACRKRALTQTARRRVNRSPAGVQRACVSVCRKFRAVEGNSQGNGRFTSSIGRFSATSTFTQHACNRRTGSTRPLADRVIREQFYNLHITTRLLTSRCRSVGLQETKVRRCN